MNLTYRKAKLEDLPQIINLLYEDELGQIRESANEEVKAQYIKAFHEININPNQYLMVVENSAKIVATCHLTIMHSLTFMGGTRMQIEAVRVINKYRGEGFSQWMFEQATVYAKAKGVSMMQLATNKKRPRAKHFYEKLGFTASHEGMKMYLGS